MAFKMKQHSIDILAFGAHPDDVELGCAGTILLQKSLGSKIGIIDLTAGELGTRGDELIRKKEATKASKALGVLFRENLGFADGFFEINKANKIEIIKRIRYYQPKIILCNAKHDRHPDHGRGAQLIYDSCFLSGLEKIQTTYNGEKQLPYRPKLLYNYIQYDDQKPDFIVDVSQFIEQKMKIAVLTKAIPSYESSIRVDSSGSWIDESIINYVVNESDSYALEEALQIKESSGEGSEVVVVTLGSEANTSKVIKDGLAKGADRGIFIKNESSTTDPLTVAKIFADNLKSENFDLILSGLQSDDMGSGQTGVLIGELLEMSTATLAIETQVEGDKIKVKRELESGWFQWVTLPFPASISIQSGINEPRYPSLKGIMGAKRKELNTLESSAESQKQSFVNLYVPKNEKVTEKIEGDADTIVAKLMDILKNKLKVI